MQLVCSQQHLSAWMHSLSDFQAFWQEQWGNIIYGIQYHKQENEVLVLCAYYLQ